jgi:hypothetical protein
MIGPVCQSFFAASGRKRFCSDACRRLAWNRQHQAPLAPIVVAPPGQPRRPLTVQYARPSGSSTRNARQLTCGPLGVGKEQSDTWVTV